METGKNNIAELGRNTRFSSTNQPAKNGRPKGVRNMATIYREILATVISGKDLEGKEQEMTIEQQMVIAIAKKAITGHLPTYRELIYGYLNRNHTGEEVCSPVPEEEWDYSDVSDEELLTVERIFKKVKKKERVKSE